MPKSQSLIRQILTFQIVALLAATTLFAYLLVVVLNSTADRIELESLQTQAWALADHLFWETDDRLGVQMPPDLAVHFSELYGRYSYEVLSKSGAPLLSSGVTASRFSGMPFTAPDRVEPFSITIGEREFSGVVVPVEVMQRPVWIRAAENLSHRDALQDDLVRVFLPRIAWIAAGIFCFLILLDAFLIKRAFRPLVAAAEVARRFEPGQPIFRLPRAEIPSEIQSFVEAIDGAVSRLQAAYEAERQFASDAAHELRTPLAVLRMRIDTLEGTEIKRLLIRDVELMTRTVNEFIELAEVGSMRGDPLGKADLREAATQVVEQQALIAIRAGRELVLTAPDHDCVVTGNQALIFCAIRNLTENAVRHAPAHSSVEIRVDRASIEVLDRGPGIPVDLREKIFDRSWRADTRSNLAGGLGLSIVRQIVDMHGATITVAEREGGGSLFRIEFTV